MKASQPLSVASRSLVPRRWQGVFRRGLVLLAGALFATASVAQGPEIALAPGSLNFGSVSGEKTREVKIRNRGDADLLIDSVSLCPGTSAEYSFDAPPGPIAPKRSADLEVTYAPVDDGGDDGCLEIASNDPAEPVVQLGLRGKSRASSDDDSDDDSDSDSDSDDDSDADSDDDTDSDSDDDTGSADDDSDSDSDDDSDSDSDDDSDGDGLRLKPSSLDFGQVGVGDTLTRTVRVQSRGAAYDAVVINRCFTPATSDEFGFEPQTEFTVEPGKGTKFQVTYAPVDEGVDEGCLEVRSGDPAQAPEVLEVVGEGVDPATVVVDLDLVALKVRKRASVERGQKIRPRIWVRNNGEVDGSSTAQLVGVQNGVVIYNESRTVRDRPGNEGVSPYKFPWIRATEEGEILWLATLDDGDPDVDEATATTVVNP